MVIEPTVAPLPLLLALMLNVFGTLSVTGPVCDLVICKSGCTPALTLTVSVTLLFVPLVSSVLVTTAVLLILPTVVVFGTTLTVICGYDDPAATGRGVSQRTKPLVLLGGGYGMKVQTLPMPDAER